MERIDERIPGIDLPLMSVSQTRGVIRRSELTDKPQRAESLDAYKVCRQNDVVFNKMSIRAGAMGVAPEDGLVTYHYEVMRARNESDPRYVVYVMKSAWFTEELIKRERGIGAGDQANVRTTEVPFSVLKTVDCYLPEPAEQRTIADFLDRETARIDTLIDEQQRLIDLLRNRRSTVIADAVVRGIDKCRLGTERFSWIGVLPANWIPAKVKHLGAVTLGKMLQGANSGSDVRAPYMRAANVQPDGFLREDDVKEMWFSKAELEALDLRQGDVVVVEGGVGGYGRAAYLDSDLLGWGFQNSINRIRPNRQVDGRYIAYFLIMARASGFLQGYCNVVSMPHLTAEKLNAMPIPLPPADEQRRIADHLDEQTSKIDTLIVETEKFIELSRERRAALITAAVTGLINVRTEAV